MNSAQDISEVIAALDEDQRALVIDFARLLRARDALMFPAVPGLDGPEYERWQANLQAHAVTVLAEQRLKLERAGLSPDGDLRETEWPEDMRVDSGTSVQT